MRCPQNPVESIRDHGIQLTALFSGLLCWSCKTDWEDMKYFGETGKCGFLKCSLANYVARGAARCGQYWRSGWKVQCWKQPCCQQCWTVFWEIIVRSLERRWNGWLAGLVGEWRGHIVLLVMGARGCLETNGSFYESSGLTSTLYPGKCPEEEGLLPSGGRRQSLTEQPL